MRGKERTPDPIRVAITGIDGAGKNSTLDGVVDRLKPDYSIVKPNIPASSFENGRERKHYTKLLKLIDNLHEYGDRTNNPKMVGAVNSIFVLLNSRLVEAGMIRNVHPDLVIGERDFHLDPSVYAIFYSPALAKRNMEERMKLVQKVTGAEDRSVIFFLTVPPDEAIKRINGRIEAEKKTSEGVKRLKWRHLHEEPHSLNRLQHEYYNAIAALRKRSPVDIIEIATNDFSQGDVVGFIAQTIDGYAQAKKNKGEHKWEKYGKTGKRIDKVL